MSQANNAARQNSLQTASTKPLFSSGPVVATPGAIAALDEHGFSALALLRRHVCGDWGCVPPEDAQANNDALKKRYRLISSYEIAPHIKIWLITEADRSLTTLLLLEEH